MHINGMFTPTLVVKSPHFQVRVNIVPSIMNTLWEQSTLFWWNQDQQNSILSLKMLVEWGRFFFSFCGLPDLLRGKEEEVRSLFVLSDSINYSKSSALTKPPVLVGWTG